MMRATLLVFVTAFSLGACAYPQTQMEPVAQPALQTANPPANDGTTPEKQKKTSATPAPRSDG